MKHWFTFKFLNVSHVVCVHMCLTDIDYWSLSANGKPIVSHAVNHDPPPPPLRQYRPPGPAECVCVCVCTWQYWLAVMWEVRTQWHCDSEDLSPCWERSQLRVTQTHTHTHIHTHTQMLLLLLVFSLHMWLRFVRARTLEMYTPLLPFFMVLRRSGWLWTNTQLFGFCILS